MGLVGKKALSTVLTQLRKKSPVVAAYLGQETPKQDQ